MKIASFNVKRLGLRKVNDEFVRKHLIKIVSRYSVVVLLEVMDQTGKAMQKFKKELNSYGRSRNLHYKMKCSKPLGRNSHQEKFVCFYRVDEVTVVDSYQYKEGKEEEEEYEEEEEDEEEEEYEDEEEDEEEYEEEEEYEDEEEDEEEEEYEEEDEEEDEDEDGDGDEEEEEEDEEEEEVVDELAREPFILLLECPNTAVQKLVLVPVHTTPVDAVRELEALGDVVEDARKRWKIDEIMILGDFNADGRYLTKKQKRQISISFPPYHWLIGDDVDTTSSNCNDHTYDRIVVYGKTMLDAVVHGSAKSYNFQKAFKLTNKQTLRISDHYLVEVELKPKQKRQAARPKTVSTGRQTQKKGPQKKNIAAKRQRGASSDRQAKKKNTNQHIFY